MRLWHRFTRLRHRFRRARGESGCGTDFRRFRGEIQCGCGTDLWRRFTALEGSPFDMLHCAHDNGVVENFNNPARGIQ
jgi:hypothetical protein